MCAIAQGPGAAVAEAHHSTGAAAVSAFAGLAWFVQLCVTRRISGYPAVGRLVRNFRRIGVLLFLLVVIPGRGEAVGFNEIRDAVALWHRVFGTLPALEQFIQEGRPPRVQNVEKLGAALEAVSREEASNPFLPLARGALFTLTKSGPVKGQAAKASSLAGTA